MKKKPLKKKIDFTERNKFGLSVQKPMWWINIVLQWCFMAYMLFNLCVIVEVPQVDASKSVHTSKEGGMYRRPHDIINIIRVILKRVQRLVILQQREKRTVSWEIHEWQCNAMSVHEWSVTLLLQSLTVQSKEEVRKRWEKSTSPVAVWQWMPVIGPWCPSNISLIPARLLTHTHTENDRGLMISISACFHLSGNTSHY